MTVENTVARYKAAIDKGRSEEAEILKQHMLKSRKYEAVAADLFKPKVVMSKPKSKVNKNAKSKR